MALCSGEFDFVIPAQESALDIGAELDRFHGWFTDWAIAKAEAEGAKNLVERAAGLLKISVATFHRWRNDAGLQPVDHRAAT